MPTLYDRFLGDSKSFNVRYVIKILSLPCLLQVPFLLIAMGISLYYDDGAMMPLTYTIGAMTLVGGICYLIGRKANEKNAGRKEGMVTVSISWLTVSLLGMLPYYIGGHVPTLADAFFETISGYTTTGATVLKDIEAMPKSLLFWRSITQWLGGVGIVVFMVALVPLMGGSASFLFNSETSGVTHERFVPRIGRMAKYITLIYVGLSVTCALLLWIGPMSLYDAVCHAATCLSTGGFSTRNSSLLYFQSSYVNWVIAIFMILGATNFTLLYFLFIRKDPKKLLQDEEWRWFLGILLTATVITGVWLRIKGIRSNIWTALQDAFVQVTSLFTTTGFAVDDFNHWLHFFGLIAIILMFISGCAGSTSGGLKTIRFVILAKRFGNELRMRTHPNAVLPVRMGNHTISEKRVGQVHTFFFAYLSLVVLGALIIALDGFNMDASFSVAIACLSNSGPGFGDFGPMNNMSSLSSFAKIYLSFTMVIGRLEIFTILSILHRNFWQN